MRRDSGSRKWLADKKSSSAAKCMSKNMFGCRFLDRRRKAEERIARRGDVSKTGRRSVRVIQVSVRQMRSGWKESHISKI